MAALPNRSDGPQSELVTITPDMARVLLVNALPNRKPKDPNIDRFALDMRLGHWRVTGASVALNRAGAVMDGQNRLLACIRADVPFTTWVVTGIDDDAMNVIDTGAKRTLADVLKIMGEVDAVNLASSIWIGWRWDHGKLRSNNPPSHTEALRWLEEHPTIRYEVHTVAGLRKAPLYLPQRIAAPFAYRARELEPEQLVEFLHKLETGLDLRGSEDPLFVYRRLLVQAHSRALSAGRGSGTSPYRQLALLVKSWNLWLDGWDVAAISFREGERFPELRGGVDGSEPPADMYRARTQKRSRKGRTA